MTKEPMAIGTVKSVCINGEQKLSIKFSLEGPRGDAHAGFNRRLSGHDGEYIRTSDLAKGSTVFNWRTWTGLSTEEIAEVEGEIGLPIPAGILLENITISGIPDFSKLPPTSRLVFPFKEEKFGAKQAILAVWEENGPCKTVGDRLEGHYGKPGLKTRFITATQNKRGVMGVVLAQGWVEIGDAVLVYPPA